MDVELPRLADTLVEGTVSRWLKQPGERVRKGEPLVEVETDKVNSELEAPADGVLSEVLAAEGETVPVGRVIARIAAGEDAQAAAREAPSAEGERVVAPSAGEPAASAAEPQEAVAGREERLAEHLRRSAAAIPQGACVREIPASAAERLARAAAAAAEGIELTVLEPASSHLVMPALSRGQAALLAVGAERDGRRLLTLCYDRRALDDWRADQLLKRIAKEVDV